jgi:hypothetical protein
MKRQRRGFTTVSSSHPPKRHIAAVSRPKPRRGASPPPLPSRTAHPPAPKPVRPRAAVARIVDDAERSLVDIIDNLLHQGVMLNADVVLALANVDLVYLRLSALLCAADRVLPGGRR